MEGLSPHCGIAALLAGFVGLAMGGGCYSKSDPCPERTAFETEVYRPVLLPLCVGCHAADGVAARSNLLFDDSGTAAALDTNFSIFQRYADPDLQKDGVSIFLRKARGELTHGLRVVPGDADDKAIESGLSRFKGVRCAPP